MIFLFVCLFLFILYAFTLLNYWLEWKSIPVFEPGTEKTTVKFSVIIPARNEEKNIGLLLGDLLQQTWPRHLFEIIVVDDHSEDQTAAEVKKIPGIKLVQLTGLDINSYKKKAIETGIMVAENEWIVTTDADCRVPARWLETIACFIKQKQPVLIAAPVTLNGPATVLGQFQVTDFMVLQGITGAAIHKNMHSMGNGANLAYEKKAFTEAGGFTGIDHIASGDDMLLMYKIEKKFPGRTTYLKSSAAIVSTTTASAWKDFFSQRIRWASKAKKYQDKKLFPILLMVYLFNLLFPGLLIAGFIDWHYWLYMAGFLAGKIAAELPLFVSVSRFFNRAHTIKWFLLLQPVHILYTIISGLFGQLGRYEWKGRKVK